MIMIPKSSTGPLDDSFHPPLKSHLGSTGSGRAGTRAVGKTDVGLSPQR